MEVIINMDKRKLNYRNRENLDGRRNKNKKGKNGRQEIYATVVTERFLVVFYVHFISCKPFSYNKERQV